MQFVCGKEPVNINGGTFQNTGSTIIDHTCVWIDQWEIKTAPLFAEQRMCYIEDSEVVRHEFGYPALAALNHRCPEPITLTGGSHSRLLVKSIPITRRTVVRDRQQLCLCCVVGFANTCGIKGVTRIFAGITVARNCPTVWLTAGRGKFRCECFGIDTLVTFAGGYRILHGTFRIWQIDRYTPWACRGRHRR